MDLNDDKLISSRLLALAVSAAVCLVSCAESDEAAGETEGTEDTENESSPSATMSASGPTSAGTSTDAPTATSATTSDASSGGEPQTTSMEDSTTVDPSATGTDTTSGEETSDASTSGDSSSGSTGTELGTAMSFFVTSAPVFDTVGAGTTGDVAGDGNLIFTLPDTDPPVVLRGVAAADAFCQAAAEAVGSPRTNWVAYLSTHGLPDVANGGNGPQIDARDRIGDGPWFNALEETLTDGDGDVLGNDTLNVPLAVILGQGRDADEPANAAAVTAYETARLDEALVLTEAGVPLALNAHDIFTGSDSDGRVYDGGYPERWFINERTPPAGGRTEWGTCNDWDYARFGTAPNTEFAQTGHTDVPSGGFSPVWNSAHDSANCTVSGVAARGGAGHVYCFAPE